MIEKNIVVVAGTPNRLNHTSQTVVSTVTRIIVHGLFNLEKIKMDIAVLKLKERLDLNMDNLDKAELAGRETLEDTQCLVIGWGRLYLVKDFPNISLLSVYFCFCFYLLISLGWTNAIGIGLCQCQITIDR